MNSLANIIAVARREFEVRIRTRSFLLGTLLLVVGVAAIAFLPVIVRYIDRTDTREVAVHVAAEDLALDPVATLAGLLNAAPAVDTPTDGGAAAFLVSRVTDLEAGRRDVTAGRYVALLGIARGSDGDLDFTMYTADSHGPGAQIGQQASNALAIVDRLARHGVAPSDQGDLFAPARFDMAWADPAKTDPVDDTMATIGQDMLSFGMTILIFMMIIMYGNWIALSVVEEKSSRVMEVVLNAATPFQLLTGKVFGVGAVAFAQYGAIVVAGVASLLLQGPVASVVLGEAAAATTLPEGLTIGLLAIFGVYGVLGFLVYAALYAAAGSLVSRTEDINAVVMPMTLVSTGGYLVGIYAATGLLDARAGWVTVLAQVPFVSPFMMLGRISTGIASPGEVVLSLALLGVTIVASLWVAARIYAAGVLLYGQRPGILAIWRLVRTGM